MKTLQLLMITFVFVIIANISLQAQQTSPIRMLFEPRQNTFSLLGAGGGNLYDFFNAAGGAAVLGGDFNFNLGEKINNDKKKLKTFLLDIKFNLFNNTSFDGRFDSLDIRRFVFQDNDFRFTLGGRYNLIKSKNKENAKWKGISSAFFDLIVVPYQIQNSAYGNKGLTVVSLNMGGKFGFMTQWGIGVFGMSINPQLDMLFVMNAPGDFTFEEVTRTYTKLPQNETLARGYIGVGCKIEIPLTDFNLFFDFRKYFKTGAGVEVEGLTDRLLFTFGGVAVGSIFKNKKKK
jgi:hypothetical protein